MKKVSIAFLVIALVAIAYAFTLSKANAQTNQNPDTKYIVIRWFPIGSIGNRTSIIIQYGNQKQDQVAIKRDDYKDGNNPTNQVIDLMNKFADQGYMLVSSVSYAQEGGGSVEIVNTLKKQ